MTTPGTGAGNSGFGTGPYGFGTPAVAPTPGGAVNRDPSGHQLGSLAISTDPATKGQYVFDSFGRRQGMPDTHHLVILAVKTELGTCCVQDLGNEFAEVRKITDAFESEQSVRVRKCLASLVTRKLVQIDAIVVQPGDGKPATTRVHLTDLTSMTPIDLAIASNG